VAQSPRKLWSYTLRGTGVPYFVDITSTGLIRSPGTVAWEPPRTQHIYLYPQKINYVPNPSFEDAGLFGWRANGALTRVAGGVDNALKNYGHVVGTRLEAVPSLLTSRFVTISAYVRGGGTSSVRLNGTAGAYITGPDIAALAGAAELTVELDVAMDTWTQSVTSQLVGQYNPSGSNQGWRLHLNVAGQQGMQVSANGTATTAYSSGVVLGFTNATRHKIGGTWKAVDGATSSVQFRKDGVNTVKITGALGTTLFNSTLPTSIGSFSDGSTPLPCNVYGLKLYAGGTLVASPDFTSLRTGQTSVTDGQGNVWTLNGAASVVSPVATRVQMGLCNWNAAWSQVEDTLSEQKPLTLHEVCQYVGWTPKTRQEVSTIGRLCTQYGIRTTEDWQALANKL